MISMKNMAILVVAASIFSTPALAAGEAYVKVRVSNDTSEARLKDVGTISLGSDFGYGVAAGYDFDIGSIAFVGAEIGYDNSLAKSSLQTGPDSQFDFSAKRQLSAVARIGYRANSFKAYGLAGYSDIREKVAFVEDDAITSSVSTSKGGFTYGGGLSYDIKSNLTLSLEYRAVKVDAGQSVEELFDVDDIDVTRARTLVGVSYRF
jgi:opacity protein-like surface antigen